MTRDIQAASEVARRAELGWFDVEFTMHGSAYFSDGRRVYQISSEAEKIYDSMDVNLRNGLLPTDVIAVTEKVPVPVGMREYISLEVKKELAKQMQQYYSEDFFVYMNALAERAVENTAYNYLEQEREQLENCFDAKKLENFELLLEHMYACRKLEINSYQYFVQWLMQERRYMDIVIVQKGINKRQFYGFGYRVNDTASVQYVSNARKEVVYGKKYELECKGALVTPVFTELYDLTQEVRLPQIKKQFEADLKRFADEIYVQKLYDICTKNHHIPKEEYLDAMLEVEMLFGSYAKETLKHYGYRWGILY